MNKLICEFEARVPKSDREAIESINTFQKDIVGSSDEDTNETTECKATVKTPQDDLRYQVIIII